MKEAEYCVVITTTDSREKADVLARSIVQTKLGACVQITPIESVYCWDSTICNEKEFKLEIKTNNSLYEKLEEFILKNHSYQTPEIIQLSIPKGSQAYLKWIDSCVNNTLPN